MRVGYLAASLMLLLANLVGAQQPEAPGSGARDLFLTVGKSVLVDSPVNIERVSVASGTIAEAVVTTPREVLVNGKAPGETSLIIWQHGGNRLFFDVIVRPSPTRMDAIRRELQRELGSEEVSFDVQDGSVFLRGNVGTLSEADRAVQIVSVLGRPVNLLRVAVPPTDAQILIKVRFASIDRGNSRDLGVNIFSTGLAGTPGSVTTGTFSPPRMNVNEEASGTTTQFTVSDALNLFFFRPDIDLGATIRALQARRLLEILAEPNVLTINGRQASFLAGGEFPYPTLQGGGAGLGAVTIQFREFGIRINFTPLITPRGTIRMQVTPEVSSLDYANGLTFQGFTIPGLATRRVQTEVELEDRQSFAIGGLLDNRMSETLTRIPGLGDIPFFGKLFRSQQLTRNQSELIVIVTPELVRPVPKDGRLPELVYPKPFMDRNTPGELRHPPVELTGLAPSTTNPPPMPVEDLIRSQRPMEAVQQQGTPQLQFVPMLAPPGAAAAPTGPTSSVPAPAAPSTASPRQ